MGEKKSFLLYISSFKQIRKLTQTQKGDLLDAIMNFQEDIPLPEMDQLVDMCFGFIADDMRRDAEKYEEIVEKRRESGRKGGKATQANQANQANASFAQANQANATSENQANQANQAVNVNVDVNEDVNVNEDVDVNVNVNESASVGQRNTNTHTHSFSNRPTNSQIAQEIIDKGYIIDESSINGFINYNEERGWKMDWKTAFAKWVEREKSKSSGKKTFLNNAPKRTGADKEENDANIAKLIAMQFGN